METRTCASLKSINELNMNNLQLIKFSFVAGSVLECKLQIHT